MLHSMTGFGTATVESAGEEITVEVRSVNHRFCDVKTRLPRDLSAVDHELTARVRGRIARGAVEVSVRRRMSGTSTARPRVDVELARAYRDGFRELATGLGLPDEVALQTVLAAEGVVVLEEPPLDLEAVSARVLEALDRSLDALLEMRATEGAALRDDVRARLERLATLMDSVEAEVPEVRERWRERIESRVQEIAGDVVVDPQRLAQEVAVLAEKADIAEETTRFRAHLEQIGEQVDADDGPVGRKLDFLVQELNREANTIGSKSQSARIGAWVVEIKSEIERIREQVQNVE